MRSRQRAIWWGLTGLFLCAASQAKTPEFPAPPDARVEIVGNDMVVGGRSMQIRQFYTRDRMEKVNNYYYRHWARNEDGEKPGYTESDAMQPWHIITRVEDGYLLTVQMQRADDGGSWGYLAVSRLLQAPPKNDPSADIPRLQGSRLMHQMQTNDAGQRGDTLLLANHKSLASNVNFYRHHFEQRGWRGDMDKAIPAAKMHVLAFTSGREKFSIVLTGDQNQTKIVVNRVIHDIL